ncbi:hypothetical protein [Scytonema sp. PRP1]|uniref:hypothetical protein n=1 Tax=Scytonema sp. PRP1 TaxID=3120513 RepID=UPI002FD18DC6
MCRLTFTARQRNRLPVVVMQLDRGLSDTNVDQANQNYYTRKLAHKLAIRRPPHHSSD